MTLRRISTRRAKTAKLRYNSTFGTKAQPKAVMSIEELKASGLLTSARKVKTPKQKWKAKADKWFSEFIRLRDSDEHGIATCITSGRRAHWRTMDCGHYISRAKESVRYDERNAHAQSKQANRFQGGHFMEHGIAIDRKYGEGTAEALKVKAGQTCRRTESDYRFLAETYKARVDRIKELEPNKYTPTR